jgi:PTH1 family peptidyl-tRNA hydrolase
VSALTAQIELVVGLGNPGPRYQDTLHNAGFRFVDEISRRHGALFRPESRFLGELCRVSPVGRDVWLLKPMTYMNHSGQSVGAFARFFKIAPERILVAHDDLDLPPGTVRLKNGGGHGGHNGLRDIFSHLGSREFLRLRLGIGHPGHKDDVIDHVLDKGTPEDRRLLTEAVERAAEQWDVLMAGDIEKVMQALHTKQSE